MNRKIILFFVLVLVTITVLMCIQNKQKPELNASSVTPTPVKTEETPPLNKENLTSYNESLYNQEVVCENCHLNRTRQYVPQADRIQGHINGLDFCIYCHAKGDDVVKEIGDLHHIRYSDCMKCHEDFDLKKMDCGNCHGYPDPFTPSNGNLLLIHLSRNVDCKNCHGDDFFRIHIEKKRFPERFRIE